MKEFTTALAAAQVLTCRLPMLWAMAWSPTPARRAEATKMIVEKQLAVAEGMNAAALAAFTEWTSVLAGHGSSPQAASARITEAAVKPGRRRVRANATRLRRRKGL